MFSDGLRKSVQVLSDYDSPWSSTHSLYDGSACSSWCCTCLLCSYSCYWQWMVSTTTLFQKHLNFPNCFNTYYMSHYFVDSGFIDSANRNCLSNTVADTFCFRSLPTCYRCDHICRLLLIWLGRGAGCLSVCSLSWFAWFVDGI